MRFLSVLCRCSALLFSLTAGVIWAQSAPAPACEITGKVTAGNTPLPGVTITAANSLTGKKSIGSTELDGSFVLAVGPKGRFVVRAEFPAFATATQEVVVNAQNCHPKIDVSLTLLSRIQQTPSSDGGEQTDQQLATVVAQRGFQNLGLGADISSVAGSPDAGTNNSSSSVMAAGMPPSSFINEGSTESVNVSGNNAQSTESMFGNPDEMRERIQEMRDRGELPGGPGGPGGGGPGGGSFGGGRGPGGGGPGVFMIGGGRGRFNFNQPHGSIFYSLDDSAFDAKPFSLTGQPTTKSSYTQNHYGFVLGGPLNIPKIYRGGTKTFFFLNYTGNLSTNPFDAFSTVPTLAERSGDFSQTTVNGQPLQLIDPSTGQLFPGNKITNINPAAQSLLAYIPEPNLPGTAENFHYVTSTVNHNQNINLRLIHNFGSGGGPGMGGGRGRFGRNNINFGFHYQTSNRDLTNPFPTLGGHTSTTGYDIPVGWTKSKGHFTNSLRADFNRSTTDVTNLYAGLTDVAAQAGITGVSTNPFDWGVPNLSFLNFGSLNDTNPRRLRNQTVSVTDGMILNHNKHNFRWGVEYRRLQINTQTDTNPSGSFIFTGLYTGYDFADFLLGMPQQASIQYGSNPYGYHFRGDVWSGYVQDDWRARSNLTLNFGVRYEYYSPYSELNNQLANLAIAPGYSAVVPVLPGQTSPYGVTYTSTLVQPDRNNFAPRVGLAWKPFSNTVVRAGYGVNYNTGVYSNIALNLAQQPPFANTVTNIATLSSPLLLQNAFATATAATTNSYGVDPNYRLGYVQIWNLDIQRQIHRDFVLNIAYTGTKGTHLDIVDDPNRTATGLLIPNTQPFLWETSVGDSIMHSGSLRVRKRMTSGFSVGATYVFSKSIDNASSIGGGATVVPQDAFNLAAERGLSSFDQRQRLTGDFYFELPWGMNKRWLNKNDFAERIFGDWNLSGNYTIASGTPFTPRILNSATDVARGSNGSLRADYTGAPVTLSDPTIGEWFNTAAFAIPAEGTFGDAGRNSIIGPGSAQLNMDISKQISFGEMRMLEMRLQASNVFNTPIYTAIDTTVGSPTFGRVISVGAMRTIQIVARFRF